MRRYLPRLLLTSALLSPMSVWALGLGDIRLNSSLNQPFDAEIELLSPTPEELQSLKVGLAGTDVFSRYGVDRPAYLSSFTFSVGRSRDGRATIKVRSNRSVTEPFVTLLVEASWGSGRLVREYTVLLDPPVFMPSQSQAPAPVATPQAGAQTEGRIERTPEPQTQEPTPAPTRTPVPTPSAQTSEPVTTPAQTSGAVGGEYAVQRNDTLWRIASGIANSNSPSEVNRTMIALYQANPSAFNGNINRLRAGAVLRVPELSEIEAISTSQAAAEVARQASEWNSSLVDAQTSEEVDRLRLVTPEEAPTPPVATPAPAAPVAPATPTAPAAGATSEQDRRLQVENPALAGVQQGVDETPVDEAPVDESGVVDEPVAEEPVAEEPVASEEPAPAQRPTPAPVSEPVAEESLLDRIRDYWWVVVLLGLLAVIAIFVRRRREDSNSLDSLDSIAAPIDYEPPARRAAPARSREPESFLNDDEATADVMDAPVMARRSESPATRPIEPVVAERSVDDTLSSDTAVRLDQQDALAEADFHMAYGLYDQAADLVKIAIEREPARSDLKLKLLEIYFVWGNKELFLDTARELHATRDTAGAGAWDKVLIMGKQIAPDDEMFKGEAGSPHVDLVDVNLEGGENRVDVDLFAEPDGESPAGLDLEFASGERQGVEEGSDLDFLLDEPQRGGEDTDPTRELDPLARTQETPTIESPMLDRRDATIREQTSASDFSQLSSEQTAEISLDDLGLDADAIDHSGALEETTSIEKDGDTVESARPIRDDEMTQLAPSLSSFDRTMEAPRIEKFDVESTGTIYIDQVDLSGGDTVEQRRDIDATASMKSPSVDLNLDNLDDVPARGDTVRTTRPSDDDFSDVFTGSTGDTANIDLDVGDAMFGAEEPESDSSPTAKQNVNEMELSELEPVTMSEVGTKLDLARAYMDMGDPDGARSILEEVLQEGNPNQKQEANRLLESIR